MSQNDRYSIPVTCVKVQLKSSYSMPFSGRLLLKQIWNEEKRRDREYHCLCQNYTDTIIILGCLEIDHIGTLTGTYQKWPSLLVKVMWSLYLNILLPPLMETLFRRTSFLTSLKTAFVLERKVLKRKLKGKTFEKWPKLFSSAVSLTRREEISERKTTWKHKGCS